MKRSLSRWLTIFSCLLTGFDLDGAEAQPPPPVFTGPTPQAAPVPAAAPVATPAPPPSAPPLRSAADLEKLVAPIALYPDPLIATILMASVYPLEVVQAARFVANTNNLANLDAQPWDANVKALARVPAAVQKLNDDLPWTIELGEAFLAQDKAIMDAIQSMRSKAQKAGTLQTNPQQTVIVTNMIVEKTVEQQVVVVTNTVVQIQPTNPSVVYVPTYNPTTVYYPPPYYVYDPIAPLVTFTAGVAMGAIIANNCNWYGGGCFYGGDVDIDIDIDSNRNVNRNTNRNTDRASTRPAGTGQKWQPDQNRLKSSGAPGPSAAARSADARGWSGAGGASGANAGARPSTGAVGARPSGGTAARPTPATTPSRPSPSVSQGANRPSPSATPGANRPSPAVSQSASRPSTPGASQNRAAPSSRPSSGGAFSGVSSGGNARASSSRGHSSRGGGGGGGRGGGGRR